MLFLDGIAVGAADLLSLALRFTGARHRTSRHDNTKRHGLKQSHHETATADDERHDLTSQCGTQVPGWTGVASRGLQCVCPAHHT